MECVEECSRLAKEAQEPTLAAVLLAAGFAHRERTGPAPYVWEAAWNDVHQRRAESWTRELRESVAEGEFSKAWAEGMAMSIDEAIQLAVERLLL